MDLEKNIRIAFEVYWKNLPVTTELNTGTHSDAFIAGAKSQAAKDYWYNIFKNGDGILEQLKNVSAFDMSKHDPIYKDWIDSVLELKEEHDIPHIVNGKDPHYPYGIIQNDPLYGATQKDFDNVKPKNIGIIGGVGAAITGTNLMFSIEQIPFEMGGLGQEHHKGVIAIVPDQATMDYAGEITRMIAENKSIHQVIVVTKEHYDAQGKDSLLSPINSIVPIADIIPEQIISKQELLLMHDKAVERSITEETYKESRAWDIKKEKKVSHKRTNKRR